MRGKAPLTTGLCRTCNGRGRVWWPRGKHCTSCSGAGKAIALLALLAVFLALPGCATTYNRATVLRAAVNYSVRTTIEADECEAMASTAQALRSGPNPAYRVIGRAGELETVAAAFDRHAIRCREVLTRDLSEARYQRMRQTFTKSWQRAVEAVR